MITIVVEDPAGGFGWFWEAGGGLPGSVGVDAGGFPGSAGVEAGRFPGSLGLLPGGGGRSELGVVSGSAERRSGELQLMTPPVLDLP